LAAAKAALLALMQNTSRVAATISIIHRMAGSLPGLLQSRALPISLYQQSVGASICGKSARSLHKITASHRTIRRAGFDPGTTRVSS
jgi:hypothetical protein